jgi:nucleotide-binding universal stress UspA family protein
MMAFARFWCQLRSGSHAGAHGPEIAPLGAMTTNTTQVETSLRPDIGANAVAGFGKTSVILVGIDYSHTSELALERALELVASSASAELHVVHVTSPLDLPMRDTAVATPMPDMSRHDQEAYQQLGTYVALSVAAFEKKRRGMAMPNLRVVTHLRFHAPAREIAQLASDLEADLVIVGMHGRGAVSRFFLGSVAEIVTRLAPCAVLVFRPKGLPPEYPRIEPPCPRCVEARVTSHGAQTWCEQHRERHGQRHVYHQADRVSGDGNLPLVCSNAASDA